MVFNFLFHLAGRCAKRDIRVATKTTNSNRTVKINIDGFESLLVDYQSKCFFFTLLKLIELPEAFLDYKIPIVIGGKVRIAKRTIIPE
jgi:hypothetical protein